MKKFFKTTLIGSALGLVSLSSFPAIGQEKPAVVTGSAVKGAAVPPTAKPADEASPELKKAAEAVAKAMDRKDCEKAFDFMTPKGETTFIGTMLLQLASMTKWKGGWR